MQVSCIDPGPHVGWASWTDVITMEHEEDTTLPPWLFYSGEMTPEELWTRAPRMIEVSDVVVCESFIIAGSRAKSSNETIEQIGVLRYLCRLAGTTFVEQPPGTGKNFAGKRWVNLKQFGWYRPGPDHANSAAGHLLFYLCQQRLIDPRDVLTATPTVS